MAKFCDGTQTSIWFPVAPGTTSLPPAPPVNTNPSPAPENSATLPPEWDPENPNLCDLFETYLPTGQPAVYPEDLTPFQVFEPFEERVPLFGGSSAVFQLESLNYALTLQGDPLNFAAGTSAVFAFFESVTPLDLASRTSAVLAFTGNVAGDPLTFAGGSSAVFDLISNPLSEPLNFAAGTSAVLDGLDPYGEAVLALEFESPDGSTVFEDLSPFMRPLTAVGSAQITAAPPPATGIGSGDFTAPGSYLTSPTAPELNFGAGDWEVRGQVYHDTVTNADRFIVSAAGGTGLFVGFRFLGGTNRFGVGRVAVAWDTFSTGDIGIVAGTWQQFRAWRDNGNVYLEFAGVELPTVGQANTNNYDLGIGGMEVAAQGGGFELAARLDDLVVLPTFTATPPPPLADEPLDFAVGTSALFGLISTELTDPLIFASGISAALSIEGPDQQVLRLQMEGANGSTTFTDTSSYGRTMATVGAAVINTTPAAAEGSSHGNFITSGSALTTAESADLNFGTGPFRIQLWIRNDSVILADRIVLGSQTAGGMFVGFQNAGGLKIGLGRSAVAWDSLSVFTVNAAGTGAWFECIWERDAAGNLTVSFDGVVQSMTNDPNTISYHLGLGGLNVGYDTTGAAPCQCRLDDVRIENLGL